MKLFLVNASNGDMLKSMNISNSVNMNIKAGMVDFNETSKIYTVYSVF